MYQLGDKKKCIKKKCISWETIQFSIKIVPQGRLETSEKWIIYIYRNALIFKKLNQKP